MPADLDASSPTAPPDVAPSVPPYVPRHAACSQFVPLRGSPGQPLLKCHVHTWGDPAWVTPGRPALVLLHGWMDVGASFQFMVDALAQPRYILAPDWRGFGLSETAPTDSYWFPDYLADLDALLDALLPDQPVDLAGHSMGGNVAMLYAGVRPARIRRLINLEGFGMPPTRAAMAPTRLARWLDELRAPAVLRSYASLDAVARRLRMNNPRLAPDRAAWLAGHWSSVDASGQYHLRADPAHKRVNPTLSRQEEAVACWRRITAPVLWAEGAQTQLFEGWADRYPRADFDARLAEVPHLHKVLIEDCGHMLHHDQPQQLAAHVETFLAS